MGMPRKLLWKLHSILEIKLIYHHRDFRKSVYYYPEFIGKETEALED